MPTEFKFEIRLAPNFKEEFEVTLYICRNTIRPDFRSPGLGWRKILGGTRTFRMIRRFHFWP